VVELEPIHYFYFSLKHVLRTMTTTFEFEFHGFCPYIGAVINWTRTYREENFVHSCEHACREKFYVHAAFFFFLDSINSIDCPIIS
jgi:hypothetical protein